jgi:processing peptidase subunit beta
MLSRISNKLSSSITKKVLRSLSGITTTGGAGITPHSKLQFSKEKLVEFGELPVGEIPDALKFDRPNGLTKLGNGVRVASETYSHTGLVTLGFYWTWGSRHETTAVQGICNFIQRLQFKGTTNRTREQIDNELLSLGGNFSTCLERERVGMQITVSKDQVQRAIDLVSDMMLHSTYNEQQVEAEREVVTRSMIELSRDQMECTLENLYYTSYRDHHMGQPVRGVRENVGNISSNDINTWVDNYCVGKNLVVVASGDCTHDQVTDSVNAAFGQLAQSSGVELANQEKPIYTPSLMFMRDDEMANMNCAVFFNAPTYTDQDYWAFQMIQRLIGDFREDMHTGANLNATDRQYNSLHTLLGNLPDVSIQKCFYLPGSDNGLFGSYIHSNEVHGNQIMYVSQLVASEYAYHINQAEIFRARARAFNDLLNLNSGEHANTQIANEVINLGRRVGRSEHAVRISNVAEQRHLQRICTEWFWDRDVTGAVWGPLHHVQAHSHYNRGWRRSTLGWYGLTQFQTP